MRFGSIASLTLAALLLAAVPAIAQDASPSPEASAAATQRDLYLDMPYSIAGFEPEIAMARGEEHFANLDPAAAADAETRAELESLLEEVGAEIEDMVSGYALVSQEDFFSFVFGIRIDGAEPGSLLPAYLPILLGDLEDPSSTAANVGGRDVTIISSVGTDDEYVALYVYDSGDTLWMLQGPEDVVEVTLEGLP